MAPPIISNAATRGALAPEVAIVCTHPMDELNAMKFAWKRAFGQEASWKDQRGTLWAYGLELYRECKSRNRSTELGPEGEYVQLQRAVMAFFQGTPAGNSTAAVESAWLHVYGHLATGTERLTPNYTNARAFAQQLRIEEHFDNIVYDVGGRPFLERVGNLEILDKDLMVFTPPPDLGSGEEEGPKKGTSTIAIVGLIALGGIVWWAMTPKKGSR